MATHTKKIITFSLLIISLITTFRITPSITFSQENSPAVPTPEIVPDPALKAVLIEILKKKQITTLNPDDLKSVFFLEAKGQGIKKLTGLEHCKNLASVMLADNEITDLSPMSSLAGVQTLTLSNNKITDITPLAGLTKLQYVDLQKNSVTDLKPLEKCTNLRVLYLSQNKITDISTLRNFPKLNSLYLDQNEVTDISVMKELKWLGTLNLKQNKITDLSPLADLKELRYTFLQQNPLTSLQILVDMAKADASSKRQFAPYWKLYLSKKDVSPDHLAQATKDLEAAGVKLTIED